MSLRLIWLRVPQESTIQATYLDKRLNVGKRSVKLMIWDTAGQERFHALGTTTHTVQCSAVQRGRIGRWPGDWTQRNAGGGWSAFLIIAIGLFCLSFLHQGQFTIGRQTRMRPAADRALL